MDPLILNRALKTVEEIYDESMYGDKDIFRIKDIIHSVDSNQWASKEWLANHFHKHYRYQTGKFAILGGWYGMMGYQLRKFFPTDSVHIVSIDCDPKCRDIGNKLFYDQNIDFQTLDISDINYSDYDAIISTSCEHFDLDDLANIIASKNRFAWVALQTNNYDNHASHISCFNSVDDFANMIKPQVQSIVFKGELDMSEFSRFMVIGR